jgi:hypothetical protein
MQYTQTGPKVAILYSLARSDGTLLSKCLGYIGGNVLLSEITPHCTCFNPLARLEELEANADYQAILECWGYQG